MNLYTTLLFLFIEFFSIFGASLKTSNIIGGYLINIEQVPHQVSLSLNGNVHFCAGSIITEWHIITAAHCVENVSPNYITVRTGVTNPNDINGQSKSVQNFLIHPDYYGSDNDIAVMKLDSPLSFNYKVQAIKLNEENLSSGGIALATGWGETQELIAVQVPIISTDDCKQYFNPGDITSHMICAGFPETGGFVACAGDSGGALVYNNLLVGIGEGCGSPGKPGVYAKVSEFTDFINYAINNM